MTNSFFGQNRPCFIICEIGINHNGSFTSAKKMIDLAKLAKVDAVKFQLRHLKTLYQANVLNNLASQDLAMQQSVDFIKKSERTINEYKKLAQYCRKKDILFMCTPWDIHSVKVLEDIGVEVYKVASADLTNLPLIDILIKTKKPLILSTGMSEQEEISKIYHYLKQAHAEFALLHCNSTYPADLKDINLHFMQKMMKDYDIPIGYSGHERGIAVSTGACALGAKIIERHFTLDRNLPGPDHQASLEPEELITLVKQIREVELALGKASKYLTQGIILNKETLGKSLVATQMIKIGTIITRAMIKSQSPGIGLSPDNIDRLIESRAQRTIQKDELFTKQDLHLAPSQSFHEQILHTWGIPARFHDLDQVSKVFHPDFVEFHLSYKDVLEPVFPHSVRENLVYKVHIPEVWPDGFILDLGSAKPQNRRLSESYIQQTIDIVEVFKKKFKLNQRITDYVVHLGGHSNSVPISDRKTLDKMYKNMGESLSTLRKHNSRARILPENMPPLPWLLGGQRFQNIFTNAHDILDFCRLNKLEMCLDVSHAYLYCQYSRTDFFEYVSVLLPIARHLHLADARGTDGEGLVIGEGDLEFDKLKNLLDNYSSKLSFIPEIWQGHQRDWEGFHRSLIRLSELGY